MAATFVNVTGEILKVLVHYFLSNSHLCNYIKTIIYLRLSKYYWIILESLKSSYINWIIIQQYSLSLQSV